jgi:hypothetical protein
MEQESTMSFQKIVLVIAIIALILTLSVIGYMMYYSAQNKPYPPSYSNCPDLWGLTGTNICTNSIGSGGSFSNIGSFITDVSCSLLSGCTSTAGWSGVNGNCDSRWVQGNSTNGLDKNNCYLLASSVGADYSTPTTVKHKLASSLDDNVNWAQTYGITWDGLN